MRVYTLSDMQSKKKLRVYTASEGDKRNLCKMNNGISNFLNKFFKATICYLKKHKCSQINLGSVSKVGKAEMFHWENTTAYI